MKSLLIIALTIIIVAFASASATIIYIPDDYATIQQGIDVSIDGDTVLVYPGTYVENINFYGHNIVLGSLFLTTEDTSYISRTIIDGDSSGSVVTFENGEDSTAIIIGLCIQNGCNIQGGGIHSAGSNPKILNNYICYNLAYLDSQGACSGGGVYCYYSHPQILNNQIFGNRTERNNYMDRGGGISCRESSPRIIGNLIADNIVHGIFGGGIYCYSNSNPIITSNLIEGNRAGDGGGIGCVESSPIIKSNLIINNVGGSSGGGVASFASSNPILYYNVIAGNRGDVGGGIMNSLDCDALIYNNTITGNEADSMGGLYSDYSTPFVINNIICGNESDTDMESYFGSAIVAYNLLGSYYPGEGNYFGEALFRDSENNDYHLMATECGDPYDSRGIDIGHPDILDSLLDCENGLGEIRSDMGAYGGGDSIIVGIYELYEGPPEKYRLFQNHPNPFNAQTTIKYILPEPALVTISIYDILGREIETLTNEPKQAGYHQTIWKADKLPSGMYFYKIRAGEYSESRKMLLLK
ncbi:MAG: T9SS type A sorting domain-containing protein [candidate division Zixibacteria bacterium]|nr:T9SS type A sorting domain-containing protein [candidate division Zixibacteria bacterium]